MTSEELAPLQNLLESILKRLSSVEKQLGVHDIETSSTRGSPSPEVDATIGKERAPVLVAYDKHVSGVVVPFVSACNAIEGLKDIGSNITSIWLSVGCIVELGSQCKKPADLQEALAPYLKDIQKYMKIIREVRLDRKYDWHFKGLMEMLVCVSWFLTSLPSVPSSFVKETIGSSDFWSNKIRKEYKGKDKKHIDFCDTMKALIVDLAAYLKEYHLSGLMWNANGIPVKDFKSSSIPIAKTTQNISNKDKVQIAGSPDIMKELAAKQSKDGSSAATNLNKVSRDQQTWRKEFKKKETTATTTVKSSAVSVIEKSPSNKKLGKPICQFQSHGSKWIIENQTKTSNPDGICTVTTSDSKEQVYIYKCQNSTIQVKGKIKSVILDSCFKTNLVFDSAISSCEVINCERVQVQVIGVCPSFAIDKTDGCLIYLSKESVNTSNIVSSKSTEMNVSFSDEKTGEQRECAIPEQFVHNIKNGMITSKVSDLYS